MPLPAGTLLCIESFRQLAHGNALNLAGFICGPTFIQYILLFGRDAYGVGYARLPEFVSELNPMAISKLT